MKLTPNSNATDPASAAPRAVGPPAVASQAVVSRAVRTQASGSQAGGSQAGGSQAGGSQGASPVASQAVARQAASPIAPPASRPTVLLAAVLAAVVALAGCAADASSGDVEPTEADDVTVEAADEPGAVSDDPGATDQAPARVARITDHLDDLAVYDGSRSETVTHTLERTTAFGSTTVLLVVDDADDRLEVVLPVRPNGTTGWIDVADVEVTEVELHVNVDLEAREMTVWDAGEEVLTTTVAIGDPDHPTPTGTFSITDKLDTGAPDGPYGPYAIGLSARSDVLTEFAGGDGQVGIHGTDDPDSIGEAVSHGCIRVPNEVVSQLAALLPLGTPVTVS